MRYNLSILACGSLITHRILPIFLAFLFCTDLYGQSSRQRRREFVEGMLRQLIDSQTAPSEQLRVQSNRTDPRPDVSPAVVSKIHQIRSSLNDLSREVSDLAYQLQADVYRTSGIRAIIGEVLQISASTTLLARRSATTWDLQRIERDYQLLDQDWRLIAFRLGQIADLSNEARRYLREIDRHNQQLGELLNVQPQLNRAELTSKVSNLLADIINLLEDVDFEVADSELRYRLLIEGRQVYVQAKRVGRIAKENGSTEAIRQEYQQFRKLWTPYAQKIRPLDNRYLARRLRHVQRFNREIQELLWLPTEIDQSEITYLTRYLQRDTDALLDGVTLRQLTQMGTGHDQIVTAANAFYSSCDDFVECVNNGDHKTTLAELYPYLEEDWNRFGTIVKTISTNQSRQIYREIDRTISEMRSILGAHSQFDQRRSIQIAASLEGFANRFDREFRQALSRRGKYSDNFRNRSLTVSKDFREATSRLHSEMERSANTKPLQQRVDEISKHWESLIAQTTQLSQQDQAQLYHSRRRITPLLVDLQTMLSF